MSGGPGFPRRKRTIRMPGNGFTVIEFIVVIVVVGAIFAVGALVLGRAFESYKLTRDTTDADAQGRYALERMVRELRDARSRTQDDIPSWSASLVDFYDTSDNRARFYQSGTQIRRSEDGEVTYQPLADSVVAGSLAFNYYANDGTQITPAVGSEGGIAYVVISFTVAEGDVSEPYRVSVRPRRFE